MYDNKANVDETRKGRNNFRSTRTHTYDPLRKNIRERSRAELSSDLVACLNERRDVDEHMTVFTSVCHVDSERAGAGLVRITPSRRSRGTRGVHRVKTEKIKKNKKKTRFPTGFCRLKGDTHD